MPYCAQLTVCKHSNSAMDALAATSFQLTFLQVVIQKYSNILHA